ncbi:MAG: FeoA family protein [Planctomycetota bacterium]|jgi:Fe2+ transport system protein FeoA
MRGFFRKGRRRRGGESFLSAEEAKQEGLSGGAAVPLTLASVGQEVVLAGVCGGRGLQHRLAEMGLTPGVRFRVLTKASPGPFIVSVKGTRLMLGWGMVHRIYVSAASAKGGSA